MLAGGTVPGDGWPAVRQVVVQVLCDLCPGSTSAVETLRWSWDGDTYVMDVCRKHARAVRKDMDRVLASARVERPEPAPVSEREASDAEVREWAEAAGVPVSRKGRVPASVREQYELAREV